MNVEDSQKEQTKQKQTTQNPKIPLRIGASGISQKKD